MSSAAAVPSFASDLGMLDVFALHLPSTSHRSLPVRSRSDASWSQAWSRPGAETGRGVASTCARSGSESTSSVKGLTCYVLLGRRLLIGRTLWHHRVAASIYARDALRPARGEYSAAGRVASLISSPRRPASSSARHATRGAEAPIRLAAAQVLIDAGADLAEVERWIEIGYRRTHPSQRPSY